MMFARLFFNMEKMQFPHFFCWHSGSRKKRNKRGFCLPPIRASCWLNLLTLHWLIQQHPQTKGWHELRSNQVQHWIHSETTRDGRGTEKKGSVRMNKYESKCKYCTVAARSRRENRHHSHRILQFCSPIIFHRSLRMWIVNACDFAPQRCHQPGYCSCLVVCVYMKNADFYEIPMHSCHFDHMLLVSLDGSVGNCVRVILQNKFEERVTQIN